MIYNVPKDWTKHKIKNIMFYKRQVNIYSTLLLKIYIFRNTLRRQHKVIYKVNQLLNLKLS